MFWVLRYGSGHQPVATGCQPVAQPVANRLPWCISGSSSELRWSWALIFYSFVVLSSTWKLPSMGFQLPLSWEIEFLCTGCNRLPDWVWFQKFPYPVSQSSSEIFYSDFFFTSCPTSQLCSKKGFSSIGLLEQIWHPYKDATVRSPPLSNFSQKPASNTIVLDPSVLIRKDSGIFWGDPRANCRPPSIGCGE